MRKLTGYIGAMIIVFALMGSILAGFALNINGQSTVINNYEPVTDVSGLYTHTQEKTYIDYNPASNYIGYTTDLIKNNPNDATSNHYKTITEGVIQVINGEVHDNNVNYGAPTNYVQCPFICDRFFFERPYFVPNGIDGTIVDCGPNFTITVSNGTITINSPNYNNSIVASNAMFYCGNSDIYDYIMTVGYRGGNANAIDIYLNDINQFIGIGGGSFGEFLSVGNTAYHRGSTATSTMSYNFTNNDGFLFGDANINRGGNHSLDFYCVLYPKSVSRTITGGIDYTESNRVNNYPISVTPSNTTITTGTIDLMNISATSYWPTNTGASMIYSQVVQGGAYGPDYILSPGAPNAGIHNYKLTDVLANYSIPANTKTIQINANGTAYTTANMSYANYSVNMDNNLVGFSNLDSYTDNTRVYYSDIFNQKDYLVYDLVRGVVDVYNYNGVKMYTNTPDKIMVCFTDTGYNNAYLLYYVDLGGSITSVNPAFNFPNDRARPYLNITTTSITAENIDYLDITKGIKINPSNTQNVIWDNQYENGDIKLLFRADSTTGHYKNVFNVSNNQIAIEYINNHFDVSLNNQPSVNVGNWRSIVLDIDLKNGKLNAVPVRTFNSYTNVVLDNANIYIGNLINATPTNIITWAHTSMSLTFNVYSTSVFMDSYGVVMVDPSLNITNYFTDLNNFYRLKLSNFSIYGDSITVNGVTGTVSGNNLTIDDNTLMIKNLAITYADGHAYIEDSNISVDLGAITDNTITLNGVWYFDTELLRGITDTKTIYEWDWSQFILDNTQFCIFFMGLAIVGLIIARHFCILSITDYAVLVVSFIIALGVQVIA